MSADRGETNEAAHHERWMGEALEEADRAAEEGEVGFNLDDIDRRVLTKLIRESIKYMKNTDHIAKRVEDDKKRKASKKTPAKKKAAKKAAKKTTKKAVKKTAKKKVAKSKR